MTHHYSLLSHARDARRRSDTCSGEEAKDGIRTYRGHGVQTCALPIYLINRFAAPTRSVCGSHGGLADAANRIIRCIRWRRRLWRNAEDQRPAGRLRELAAVRRPVFERRSWQPQARNELRRAAPRAGFLLVHDYDLGGKICIFNI